AAGADRRAVGPAGGVTGPRSNKNKYTFNRSIDISTVTYEYGATHEVAADGPPPYQPPQRGGRRVHSHSCGIRQIPARPMGPAQSTGLRLHRRSAVHDR